MATSVIQKGDAALAGDEEKISTHRFPPDNTNNRTIFFKGYYLSIYNEETEDYKKHIDNDIHTTEYDDYEAERDTTRRAQDPDLQSLEEQSRAALRPKISTKASKTRFTLQRLDQPALHMVGLQLDQAQLGSGECQGGSRDQPIILDNDNDPDTGGQAEGASGEADTGRIDLDASLRNTFATSGLASVPTESH